MSEVSNKYLYNTPIEISKALVDLLPEKKYNNIIDICCGSWNLIKAAYDRFPDGKYVGVDVDGNCGEGKPEYASFIEQDGRVFALESLKKYDLVLSNPPYGYLSEQGRMFDKLEGEHVLKQLKRKRYECEMIQANLLLGNENTVYLFILPVTILEGSTFNELRKKVKESYDILSITELPINAFGKNRIATFAVIIKQKCLKRVECQRYVIKNNGFGKMICLEKGSSFNKEHCSKYTKKCKHDDREVNIYRGNISGNKTKEKKGKLVYHCSGKWVNNEWIPLKGLCSKEECMVKGKKVKKGDIIIDRIGRNVGAWCVVKKGGYLSDCLIAISSEDMENTLEIIKRNSDNHVLRISPRGVSVQYLTIEDVRSLLENEYDR